MKNDLQIRAWHGSLVGGYDYYGVRMGKGFIDALESGTPMKDPIENATRLEDGVRMVVNTKRDKRTLNLTFNIHGNTRADYQTKKRAFVQMLELGVITIKVNDGDHPDYYHLVYTGKSVTYKHSYNGMFGVWTAQFIEPDPSSRTIDLPEYLSVV